MANRSVAFPALPLPFVAVAPSLPISCLLSQVQSILDTTERGGHVAYRILIVEDDSELLGLMSTWLSRGSFECVCCETAVEAVDAIAVQVPDAAILDVRLPGMDAFELVEVVRARGDDFPVILFTGALDAEVAARASALGVADILSKSAPLSVVEAKLRMVLAERASAEGAPTP
jgi:DNA-binding response OmpR family regulator